MMMREWYDERRRRGGDVFVFSAPRFCAYKGRVRKEIYCTTYQAALYFCIVCTLSRWAYNKSYPTFSLFERERSSGTQLARAIPAGRGGVAVVIPRQYDHLESQRLFR
jgi:hypothetical protein